MRRLLFQRYHLSVGTEFDDAVTLRIAHSASEHGRILLRTGVLQQLRQIGSVENVVAQDQTRVITAKELFAEYKCLGESVRHLLDLIREPHAELGSVTQQPLEHRQILRRGNDQHLPNIGEHQRRYRIKDHGLVVNRQQLLGDYTRQRILHLQRELCPCASTHSLGLIRQSNDYVP